MTTSSNGFIFIVIAIICNGSFSVPFKISKEIFKLDPVVFQLYCSVGVFLSSWLSQAFLPLNDLVVSGAGTGFVFSPYGLISGSIIMVSLCSSFFAVEYLGIALGPAIYMGTTLIVSFLWGVKLDGIPGHIDYSIGGLILITFGIFGIAFCQDIVNALCKKSNITDQSLLGRDNESSFGIGDPQSVSHSSSSGISSLTMSTVLIVGAARISNGTKRSNYGWYYGIMWAVFCGCAGASFLVPMQFVPPSQQGLAYLPAFGVGALVTAPVLFGLRVALTGVVPELKVREGALLGIAAGFIWNTNNAFAIAAIKILGYGLAMPLAQCAIVVASLWGIVYFKEIQGTTIAVFVNFAVILLAGAVLLSMGGQ